MPQANPGGLRCSSQMRGALHTTSTGQPERLMPRLTRRKLTVITLLIALFFSQLWVAVYACTITHPSSTVSTAPVTVFDGHSDLRDHHTAAACQAHCDNSAQPDHAQQPSPPPLVWTPLIWGASTIPALAIQPRSSTRPEPILLSASPPPRILFHVFRI
jgi:hypothetical protein